MSRVITSGACSAILSAATKGSPAVPMTSIPDPTTAPHSESAEQPLNRPHENTNLSYAHTPRPVALRRDEAGVNNLEPAKPNFAVSRIEMNIQACRSAQARRNHFESLRAQDVSANRSSSCRRTACGAAHFTRSTSPPPNTLTPLRIVGRPTHRTVGQYHEWQNPQTVAGRGRQSI